VRLFHEGGYAAWTEAMVDSLTRLDSLARAADGDSAVAPGDSAAAPDTLAATDSLAAAEIAAEPPAPRGPPRLAGPVPGPGRRGRTLPGRRIVVLLAAPLPPGVPFEVIVSGVVNINGVREGGGSVTFVRAPPAAEAPAAAPAGPPPDTLSGRVSTAARAGSR